MTTFNLNSVFRTVRHQGIGIATLALLLVLAFSVAHAIQPQTNGNGAETGNAAEVESLRLRAQRLGKVRVIARLDLETQPEGQLPNIAAIIAQKNAIRAKQEQIIQALAGLDPRKV